MLTLISVSFKSRALLEVNYELVKALNPTTPFRWIVVQNTPPSSLDSDLPLSDSRFEVIRGPVITELERQSVGYGSFHHAKALNLAANYSDSDLLFTLDPDCFVLMPDWMARASEHVRSKRLAFFGTPYHPRHFVNYRNFPNVVCMMINRRLLQEADYFSLNFMPDLNGRLYRNAVREAMWYQARSLRRVLGFLLGTDRHRNLQPADWRLVIVEWLRTQAPQLKVGRYADTGTRLLREYRTRFSHEELTVFARDDRGPRARFFESLLPDRFRRFPRERGQFRPTPDPFLAEFEETCEQFFWRDELFAFHVNGTWYSEEFRRRTYARIIDKLREFIARTLAGQGKDEPSVQQLTSPIESSR